MLTISSLQKASVHLRLFQGLRSRYKRRMKRLSLAAAGLLLFACKQEAPPQKTPQEPTPKPLKAAKKRHPGPQKVFDPGPNALPLASRGQNLAPTGNPQMVTGTAWKLDRSGYQPPNIPDALTFIGWSKDGTIYAYETRVTDSQESCIAPVDLWLTDAKTGKEVPGASLHYPHPRPSKKCKQERWMDYEETKAGTLKKYEIITGNLFAPRPLTPSPDGNYLLRWSKRAASKLRFENRFTVKDPLSKELQKGAAYYLELTHADGSKVLLEDGKKRRAGVMRYRIVQGRVFVSPNQQYAAVVLQQIIKSFEGARKGWISNGFALPKSAPKTAAPRTPPSKSPAYPAKRK